MLNLLFVAVGMLLLTSGIAAAGLWHMCESEFYGTRQLNHASDDRMGFAFAFFTGAASDSCS
jgi:hypothetical protein